MITKKQVKTPSGYIQITESGQVLPLMLVHGLFVSGTTFDLLLDRLPEGIRAICIDLPESGNSTGSKEFSPSWQAYNRCIIETADALGLDKFSLLGHSMGGGISALVAAHDPRRLEKLVLVNAVSLP